MAVSPATVYFAAERAFWQERSDRLATICAALDELGVGVRSSISF